MYKDGITNLMHDYPPSSQYSRGFYGACPMYVKHLKGFEDAFRWWKTLDWDNPNPYDVRYLLALQWAYLERFGQGYITSYNIADKGVIIDNFAKFFFDSYTLITNPYTYGREDTYFYSSIENIMDVINVDPNVLNVALPYNSLNKKWQETTVYNRNGIVKYNEFKNLDFPGLQTYIKALYSFFKNSIFYYSPGPLTTGRIGTALIQKADLERYVSPTFFYNYSEASLSFDIKDRICKNIKKQNVNCYARAYNDFVKPSFHLSTQDALLCSYYYDENSYPHYSFYGYDREPVPSYLLAWADLFGSNISHNGDGFVTYLDCCLFMFYRKFYFTNPIIGEPIILGYNPLEKKEKKGRIKIPISITEDGMSCEILWHETEGWKEFFDEKEFSIKKVLNAPGVFHYSGEIYNTGIKSEFYSFDAQYGEPIIFVDLTKGVNPLCFV